MIPDKSNRFELFSFIAKRKGESKQIWVMPAELKLSILSELSAGTTPSGRMLNDDNV